MSGTGVADEPAPAIDCHAHIFTRSMSFAADAHSRPDYDYPAAAFLADLDRHGIARGVIAAASLFDDGNANTLAALATHSRLRATVLAPPDTDAATLRDLTALGVVGVRLVWRRLTAPPRLDEEPYRGFLRRLADAGLHVELLAESTQLTSLLPMLATVPVCVVVDHFGVPSRDERERQAGFDAVGRAVDGGRTWVKLSAGFRLPYALVAEATERLLHDAGPSRLLWGSDAPFVNHEGAVTYADTLTLYRSLVPDAATRRAIDATGAALFFEEKTWP